MSSVTRWLDYSSTFGHLYQWKLAQWHTKFAKVGPRFSQIVNKPSKNCPRLWRFCQNGEILPNLVTLVRKNSISGTDRLQILTRFDKSTPPHDASSYYSSHQSFRERDSRLRRSCRTIRSETPACQSVEVYYVHVTIEIRGREPWSSGYGWRLMFERSWVQISQGRKYKEEEIWTKQDENTERERHKGGK